MLEFCPENPILLSSAQCPSKENGNPSLTCVSFLEKPQLFVCDFIPKIFPTTPSQIYSVSDTQTSGGVAISCVLENQMC